MRCPSVQKVIYAGAGSQLLLCLFICLETSEFGSLFDMWIFIYLKFVRNNGQSQLFNCSGKEQTKYLYPSALEGQI